MQMAEWKFGGYSSSYLGNDLYFFYEAMNLLIADVGEEWLEREMEKEGKNWQEIKLRLQKLKKTILRVKMFYDPIIDKKFSKKELKKSDVQNMFESNFEESIQRLPLIESDLYETIIFLLKKTMMGSRHIGVDAFRVLEHQGMRKLDKTSNERKNRENII